MFNWEAQAGALMSVCAATFGETVPVIYQRGPLAFTINAIFDPHGSPFDESLGAVMQVSVTTADVVSQFPNETLKESQNGDLLTIRGTVYVVCNVLVDAGGGTKLTLTK